MFFFQLHHISYNRFFPGLCNDTQQIETCQMWASKGFCAPDNKYFKTMRDQCRKTCNLCGKLCFSHPRNERLFLSPLFHNDSRKNIHKGYKQAGNVDNHLKVTEKQINIITLKVSSVTSVELLCGQKCKIPEKMKLINAQ